MSDPTIDVSVVKTENMSVQSDVPVVTEDLQVADVPSRVPSEGPQNGAADTFDKNGGKNEMDVFAYTKFDEFTSEIFKIEIQNLPKYETPAGLKKLLRNKFKLEAKKVKVIKGAGHKPSFGFATFCNDADRDRAIESLNNFVLKKQTLKVTKAKPAKDPAFEKKNQRDANDEPAV